MMINPSKRSLLLNHNFTHDFKMENGEICVIRSTMDALEPLFKGNVNGLEVLYTDYFIPYGDVWTAIREKRDIFECNFRDNMVKASFGMMKQKQASLLKSTGGNQAEFFKEHGYNGKDYIHIVRLYDVLYKIVRYESFDSAMRWGNVEFVKAVREGKYSMQDVLKHSGDLISAADFYVTNFLQQFSITSSTQTAVKSCFREDVANMLCSEMGVFV